MPESQALSEALKKAATPHELRIAKGMIHGFLQLDMLPECRQGLADIFDFLERWV